MTDEVVPVQAMRGMAVDVQDAAARARHATRGPLRVVPVTMFLVGKKAAGRLLDDVLHDEYA